MRIKRIKRRKEYRKARLSDRFGVPSCYSVVVQEPITDRIKKLRQEIAEISDANRRFSRGPNYGSAEADQERRLQRLQEILDELVSLTDWKKL